MAESATGKCPYKMHGGAVCGRGVFADSGFCLAHADVPDRPADKFQQRIDVALGDSEAAVYDMSGFIFPESGWSFPDYFGDRLVILRGAKFLGRADFTGRRFEHRVDFGEAEFVGDAVFGDCLFEHGADFASATLRGEVVFRNCEFGWRPTFDKVHMKDSGSLRFDGEDAHGDRTDMFLQGADFTAIRQDNPDALTFRRLHLNRCRFLETDIGRTRFIDVSWPRVPGVFSRQAVYDELTPDRDYERWRQDDEDKGDPPPKRQFDLIAQVYRRLQANYTNNYRYAEAGDAYIGEQEMLRRGLPWFWRHFGVGNLYRLFSLYGQSYRLPLIWILVLLVLTPWVLMIGGIDLTPAVSGDFENTVFFTLEGLASDWEATVADYLDALMASFSFATFNRQEMSVVLQHPWQRALASLETALLIVFVTFFLLAIRRRFTRKSF